MLKPLILAFGFVAASLSFTPSDGLITAQNTTHFLQFSDGSCTGTAVGPHTILTAAHCMDKPVEAIDGHKVTQLSVVGDGRDHALVRVSATFTDWTQATAGVVQGEHIFIIGNPGDLRFMYRNGYMAGYMQDRSHHSLQMYDLRIWFGDSGAAIWDDRGRIVGVISGFDELTNKAQLTIAIGLPLAFTQKQWMDARR